MQISGLLKITPEIDIGGVAFCFDLFLLVGFSIGQFQHDDFQKGLIRKLRKIFVFVLMRRF